MSTELRSASRTDIGRAREGNEDAVFAGRHTFAVADGLGGHRAGEVASNLALETIEALDEQDPPRAAAALADAVRKANRAVHDQSQDDPELKGMGTTMTAIVVDNGIAHLAHVGDSRAYLLRAGRIQRLSSDHTLVARMVDEGKITPEQAEHHPQRSILTRALGADRNVDVDSVQIPLASGDRLVLCSDGLTSVLTDDEIGEFAGDGDDLDEICSRLIDEANARGGPDNITTVLVEVTGPGAPAARTPRAQPRGRRGRKLPVRALVWLALIAAAALGGVFVARAVTNNNFYVGVNGNHVAIYRGLPVEFAGVSLSRVEELAGLTTQDVADWFLPRLREGVRVKSLAEARRYIREDIPRATADPSDDEGVPSDGVQVGDKT